MCFVVESYVVNRLCSKEARFSIQSCSSPASREGNITFYSHCSVWGSPASREGKTPHSTQSCSTAQLAGKKTPYSIHIAAQLAGKENSTLQPSQLGRKNSTLPHRAQLCCAVLCCSGLSGKIEVELNSSGLGKAEQKEGEYSLCCSTAALWASSPAHSVKH